MIIKTVPNASASISDDTTKWVGGLKVGMPPSESTELSDDIPPAYLESESSLSRPCTIPNLRPSNFVSLNRANETIKGSWLIDTSLAIPSSFLPPLSTEGIRNNLAIESKNGGVDADVYLLPTSHSNANTSESKFVFIYTQSNNGSVRTRLHDIKSVNGETRPAIRFSTRSSNGSIYVQLPRSFCGPIRIRTGHGTTRFSEAVQAHLTPFSDLDHVQRSFLGHFNPSQWDIGAPWEGDELSIETKNGSVKVAYDDESETNLPLAVQSFFTKLLSDLSGSLARSL